MAWEGLKAVTGADEGGRMPEEAEDDVARMLEGKVCLQSKFIE